MLMTLYGTGARRTEVAHLKVGDIDSRQMVVHIHGGKSNRDRDVILSRKLLDALRDYRRGLRRSRTDDLGETWMLKELSELIRELTPGYRLMRSLMRRITGGSS